MSVEVVLTEAARVAGIWVAQNPYQPVGGSLKLTGNYLDGTPVDGSIALSGSGGWRSFEVNPPAVLDRFTITRNNADSDVVELLVCLAP